MSKQPLITPSHSIEKAWEDVLHELNSAVRDSSHPFRFLSLATVDEDNQPDQRTVVMRSLDHDSIIEIHTDIRSSKVAHIQNNPAVSLHFYNPNNRLQLKINGEAHLVTDEQLLKETWEDFASKGAHSYTAEKAPGTPITKPEEAYHWDLEDPQHFTIIQVKASKMEFLQLNGNQHLRGTRVLEGNQVIDEWITP